MTAEVVLVVLLAASVICLGVAALVANARVLVAISLALSIVVVILALADNWGWITLG